MTQISSLVIGNFVTRISSRFPFSQPVQITDLPVGPHNLFFRKLPYFGCQLLSSGNVLAESTRSIHPNAHHK